MHKQFDLWCISMISILTKKKTLSDNFPAGQILGVEHCNLMSMYIYSKSMIYFSE